MSSKLEFVEEVKGPGANVTEASKAQGVSRQTGHKWKKRFEKEGYAGLEERSRTPHHSPQRTAEEVVAAVLEARAAHPRWGPKKLHEVVKRTEKEATPSVSTIARILRRLGLVRQRRARRPLSAVERAPEVVAQGPNDVWTVDFKGWWRTEDGYRCEPLTVRDAFSRYLLDVVVLEGTAMPPVRAAFERLFRSHGLPAAIQCDNGTPFICSASRGGLTQLSAYWVSLGIKVVRSRPGCPQDNGGHERMHRDLRADVQLSPEVSRDLQQRACSKWRQEFNHVRPHEALGGKVPADFYRPSPRRSLSSVEYAYPAHWIQRRVQPKRGIISIEAEDYSVGAALGGHTVALEPLHGLTHRIWFRGLDLGELELAPPPRLLDQVIDAHLERPFRRARRGASATCLPSPNETKQDPAPGDLGSSAVSPTALEVPSA